MSIEDVNSLEVTTATRNTKVNGVDVKKNDYIGILNHNLVSDKRSKIDCIVDSLSKVDSINDRETLLLIFGKDMKNQKEKDDTIKQIKKNYPSLNIDIIDGEQDVYCYIAAVC